MSGLDDQGTPFPDGELQDAVEVGAVDNQSVRVWIRQPRTREVWASLEVPGQPIVTESATVGPETDWTGVIQLSLPKPAPGATFTCTVADQQRSGRLAPADESHANLTFAFGSCHRPFTLGRDGRIHLSHANEFYPAILSELRHVDASFVLLLGDQVYSDELAPASVRKNIPRDSGHPPPLPVVLDAYRSVYRGYLGHVGFRRLRETFPTYCIWDDHDIFDNWGSLRHESPLDRAMFKAACRAYGEYQHQRNPSGGRPLPPFDYTFRYGDIGFLVLDVRGARSYREWTILGKAQRDRIRAFLDGEQAATLQTLFVISSVPVAHTARWVALLFGRAPFRLASAVRDRWCSRAFIKERDDLLTRLFTWQATEPERQVFILSGDIHMANSFTIRQRNGPGVIQQFTSSAISTPHGRLDGMLNRIVSRGSNLLEPNVRFQRHFLAFQNNFGLVGVHPLPAGGHHVEFSVRGWDPKARRVHTVGRRHCYPSRITCY